jgi:hypothetical protein
MSSADDYVTLVSAEGFEFVIERRCALMSGTIKVILPNPQPSTLNPKRCALVPGTIKFFLPFSLARAAPRPCCAQRAAGRAASTQYRSRGANPPRASPFPPRCLSHSRFSFPRAFSVPLSPRSLANSPCAAFRRSPCPSGVLSLSLFSLSSSLSLPPSPSLPLSGDVDGTRGVFRIKGKHSDFP